VADKGLQTPARKLCEVAYINDKKGYGLIATECIPAGTRIFVEQIIVVTRTMRRACGSPAEYNKLIGNRAKALGRDFVRGFLSLPSKSKAELGVFGGIVEASHHPAKLANEPAAIVGLQTAYLNHACIPNSCVSFITAEDIYSTEAPTFEGKQWLTLYACAEIHQGDEITASYMHINRPAAERKKQLSHFFGFDCVCNACGKQEPEVEKFMERYDSLETTMTHPRIVENEPALALQTAYHMSVGMAFSKIFDLRYGSLWEQCARIAAFHSDHARAAIFVGKALSAYKRLEGHHGCNYARMKLWQEDGTDIPRYGSTNRGLFDRTDILIFNQNWRIKSDMVFMLDTNSSDHIRPCEYRRRSVVPEDHVSEEEGPKDQDLSALIEELTREKTELDKERLDKGNAKNKKNKSRKKRRKGKGNARKPSQVQDEVFLPDSDQEDDQGAIQDTIEDAVWETTEHNPAAAETAYGLNEETYSHDEEGYDPPDGAYDPDDEAYNPNREAYEVDEEAYGPNEEAYSPNDEAHYPGEEGYDPNEVDGPNEEAYPNEENYDPNEEAYEPDNEAYDPNGDAQDPKEAYYPSAEAYDEAEAYGPNKEVYDSNDKAHDPNEEEPITRIFGQRRATI